MEHYISVDEISTKIDVSAPKIYKVAKSLDIDTKKITEKEFNQIKEACEETIALKKSSNAFNEAIKNVKVEKSEEISSISGSTIEQRLVRAKKDYDNVLQSIDKCLKLIELQGESKTNINGSSSSNPYMKEVREYMKIKIALNKEINELEEKLKLSVATSKFNIIDDE